MRKYQRQQGIGLLETLLVLVIVVAVILSVTMQYRRWQWERDAAIINHSVALLKQAANLYYYQHCSAVRNNNLTISYQDVVDLLPKDVQKSIQNPWAADVTKPYSIYIKTSMMTLGDKDKVYYIEIDSALKQSEQTITSISTVLNAQYKKGSNTVFWQFLPNSLPKSMSPQLWVLNSTSESYSKELIDSFGKKGSGNDNYCPA